MTLPSEAEQVARFRGVVGVAKSDHDENIGSKTSSLIVVEDPHTSDSPNYCIITIHGRQCFREGSVCYQQCSNFGGMEFGNDSLVQLQKGSM